MKRLLQIMILFLIGTTHAAETENQEGTEMSCRAVILQFGDSYWRNYKCASCGSIATSRPNSHGRQQCKNCPAPHTNEPWIDLPQDTVMVNGQEHFRIFVPEAFVSEGDASKEFVETGALQKCPFCTSTSFSNQNVCGGCGATFSAEKSIHKIYIPESAPKKSGNAAAPTASGISAMPSNSSSSLRDSGNLSSHYDAPPSRRPIPIIYKAALGFAGIVTAITLWNISRTPFILEGHVSSVDGKSAIVSYSDRQGQIKQINMRADDTGSIEVGQTVEIHMRRWGGIKGGETSSGDILLPQKK